MITTGFLLLLGTNIYNINANAVPEESIEIRINENNDFKPIVQSFGKGQGLPFVNNFIHQGSNFFFKPQFMMPSLHVKSSAVGAGANVDCEEVKVEENIPIVAADVIVSVPQIVEEVILNLPEAEPCTPDSPETPILIEPMLTDIEIELKPDIPPAPVLPPLALPEFPVMIDESVVEISEPCVQEGISLHSLEADAIIPNSSDTIVEMIPLPPKLPLVPLPELPIEVVIKEPCPEVSVVEIEKFPSRDIELETMVFRKIVPSLDIPTKTIVLVPPPPEMPTNALPKLPLQIIVPENVPEQETIVVGPNACVRDIVVERVIPNIVVKNRIFSKFVVEVEIEKKVVEF